MITDTSIFQTVIGRTIDTHTAKLSTDILSVDNIEDIPSEEFVQIALDIATLLELNNIDDNLVSATSVTRLKTLEKYIFDHMESKSTEISAREQ